MNVDIRLSLKSEQAVKIVSKYTKENEKKTL